jgi:uncharacterized protein YjiS (DUF1127 family)
MLTCILQIETLASLLRILHGLGTAYRLGRERCRQRRQLMEMDDRELKDIGMPPRPPKAVTPGISRPKAAGYGR